MHCGMTVKYGSLVGFIIAIIPVLFSWKTRGWVSKFDSPSYAFHDMPDMTGKTVLVTGGTSGIGLVTARELARKGAHVTITARSTAKGESAKNVICSDLQSSQCSRVETLTLDLASLNNIAKFSDHFHQKHNSLDVLILNAGVMGCPFQLSEDGYELQFATNHLGHFFLTYLLLPLLDRANEGRVVTVTSGAHQAARGGIRFDSLDSDRDYSYFGAYAQSKLANILFSNELSRQLQSRNSTITANSLHPGFIRTNLARHIMAATRENSPWYWVMDVLEMYVMSGAMSVNDGALTQLYVATAPELAGVSGHYFIPIALRGHTAAIASDLALQRQLWEVSENLINDFINA